MNENFENVYNCTQMCYFWRTRWKRMSIFDPLESEFQRKILHTSNLENSFWFKYSVSGIVLKLYCLGLKTPIIRLGCQSISSCSELFFIFIFSCNWIHPHVRISISNNFSPVSKIRAGKISVNYHILTVFAFYIILEALSAQLSALLH